MDYLDTGIVTKLKAYADYDDPDIKALALAGLHYSQYKNKEIKNYLISEIEKLGEKRRAGAEKVGFNFRLLWHCLFSFRR